MIDPTTVMASRGKRLGGALIDAFFGIIIMVPLMLFTGYLGQIFSEGLPSFTQRIGYGLIGFAVFMALHGYLLYTRGQTIGKTFVKTKIVDQNGNIPSFEKLIVLRYLILGFVANIPIIGSLAALANALFIFRKDRRCIHDHLAGTWVIDNQLVGSQNVV